MMNNAKHVYFLLITAFVLLLPLPLYAAAPIQRVPISDAIFAGPTEIAPSAPVALHSVADFENFFGNRSPSGPGTIYELLISAQSFFEQGGETLYITPLPGGSGPERYRKALNAFPHHTSIGLLAAPGYGRLSNAERYAVAATLINKAETSGHGFAILEPVLQSGIDTLLRERERYNTVHAGLYAPWMEYYDNRNAAVFSIPPSGTIAGVIAKSEIDHGAHKAPAGVALNGLSGLSQYFTDEESSLLSASDVNPLRWFAPSDYKVWGARTLTTSIDGRYISVQRYGAQLELSIRLGTKWVTGETNAETLWSALRTQIETFLHEEWQSGSLIGATPGDAYFVRCDQSTMSASDISAGRTICIWGVSLIKPAEFSLFTLTHERMPDPIDSDPPAGYTLRMIEALPGPRGEPAIALQIKNAEIGSEFRYYIGTTGGPDVLYGEGNVETNDFDIIVSRISTLPTGQISVYFSLTDKAKNLGPWVSPPTDDTFKWTMFLPAITINAKK